MAGLVMAATSIQASSCIPGAKAITLVQSLGITVERITCDEIKGVFAYTGIPKNPNDPAQVYIAAQSGTGKCVPNSGCLEFRKVALPENSQTALDDLAGDLKAKCEAAKGKYSAKVLQTLPF